MIKNERLKGYALSILATIALSNVYIFSKAALSEVHISQFGFYWFGIAIILNSAYIISRKKHKKIKLLTRKQHKTIILLGLIEVVSTTLFFSSIHIVPNPAVVSFLSNIGTVFVIMLGFLFLSERFNTLQIVGIALTLIGAFIISFNRNSSLNDFFVPGTWFILGSALLGAIAVIIAKKNIGHIEPAFLGLNRSIYLFIFSSVMLLVFDQSLEISTHALFNITLGSILGPFFAILTSLMALKYIEASLTSIVMSSKSLFVLIGAYIYFDIIAFDYQIFGGILTIIGVIIITKGKK